MRELILMRKGFPRRVELRCRQKSLEVIKKGFLRFQTVGYDQDGPIGKLGEQGRHERLAGIRHGVERQKVPCLQSPF